MRGMLGCLLLAVSLAGSTWAQGVGTIRGTVVDPEQKPVAKARVHIDNIKPNPRRPIRFYETDSEGRFSIERVPWGTYRLLAGKDDSGYPDMLSDFYSENVVPLVTLTELLPAVNVTVQLLPKAGVLEVSSVIDVATGNDVLRSAVITLRRVGNPKLFITTSATVPHLLVPSRTGVSIEITAPGYKPWPSDEEAARASRIRLEPGEALKLDVKLRPDPAAGK